MYWSVSEPISQVLPFPCPQWPSEWSDIPPSLENLEAVSIWLFLVTFKLAYIHHMWKFHGDNSTDVYSELWTSSYPLLYLLLPPSFANSVWWVSLCYLYIHICNMLWSFSLLPPFPTDSPRQCHYHHHHYHFRSRFHIWEKTCNIRLYLPQHYDLQF
jgi:hypothetical protein